MYVVLKAYNPSVVNQSDNRQGVMAPLYCPLSPAMVGFLVGVGWWVGKSVRAFNGACSSAPPPFGWPFKRCQMKSS